MKKVIQSLFVLFVLLACTSLSFAQSRVVTGTVKNKNGEPVPQATIQQKGTNKFVTASDEGAFSIEVSGDKVVLIVSSSGFETSSFNVRRCI